MESQNAVYASILENLDGIKIIYKESYEAFKNDRGNTGDSKEYSIQQFIQSYLPNNYRIKKGCIYNKNSYSKNIDCVVLAPNHPPLLTPKRDVILAEGVYAAIEVKPDIKDKREFLRGLLQIKSIKDLQRDTHIIDLSKFGGEPPREDWQNKIPAILFATKSLVQEELHDFLKNKITENEFTIYDLPDMIFTLDHGLYIFAPNIERIPFGKWFINNFPNFSKSVLLHFRNISEDESLALFVMLFLCLPNPVNFIHQSIVLPYLKEGLINLKMNVCGLDLGVPT